MQFALFTHLPWPEGTDPKQIVEQATQQIQYAEELGFKSAWLAEHHFTRYSLGSSSLILATHLAALTKKIRLGTAVLVSPLHNPIRLAEDTATLDLVSGGRLDVGFGRGNSGYEYHGFNISSDDGDECFDLDNWNTPRILEPQLDHRHSIRISGIGLGVIHYSGAHVNEGITTFYTSVMFRFIYSYIGYSRKSSPAFHRSRSCPQRPGQNWRVGRRSVQRYLRCDP